MATVTGILLDVSGSMRENARTDIEEDGGAWVRSLFQVIDDLIKHDVSTSNKVFAVGFGANSSPEIFDIISTIQQFQNQNFSPAHLNRILDILEMGGANTLRMWAPDYVIRSFITDSMGALILSKLESDSNFVKRFVYEFLPPACRNSYRVTAFFGSYVKQASESDVKGVIEKVVEFFSREESFLKEVNESSVFNVHDAAEVVRGCVDPKQHFSEERKKELLKTVEPFIYGLTPFFESTRVTKGIFSIMKYKYPNHKKVLFVLSDGVPTDTGRLLDVISEFADLHVTVVCCFVSRYSNVEPKRLYSREQTAWEEGAKLMFRFSSTITSQYLPRVIFRQRGWKIDIEDNATKLFLNVNHPDHVKDAAELARKIVCCQDTLSDLLPSVSLDIYINQSTTGFTAKEQVGGTCYANASATVLHLSMKRILGRDGGYPEFDKLRDELIASHGTHGANTLAVLQTTCPKYRLRCRNVDVHGALEAVADKRPVVARFYLTDDEWDIFSLFYRNNPRGVLTTNELDITRRRPYTETSGHAVVLTSFDSDCLRLMNSWGQEWADMGFFRIQNSNVLGLEFIDVYWTKSQLSDEERAYYCLHGAEVAGDLVRKLKGLQTATYECPACHQVSLVTEFTGTLLAARCPNPSCSEKFSCKDEGNILAMNMYLTSLSR